MTRIERFASDARRHLRQIARLSGEVIYSSAATLTLGPLYLLGHNPGGSPDNNDLPTIGRSLHKLPTRTTNSYLDYCWNGRPPGGSPLQVRVRWLLEQLGLDPRRVLASNLIFPRSRDAATSKFEHFAELSWPVHEQILTLVQPRLILAFGNSGRSPYSFLARKFQMDSEARLPSGHGMWACRTFVVPGRFRVVGLPHLSRYRINGHPKVINWIKSLRAL